MNTKIQIKRHFYLAIYFAVFAGLGVDLPSCQADTLSQELQKQIPQVIRFLNEHNHKTVGVLKFRVKKPGQKTSDSVGPINSLMADRLEVGLVLANPFEKEQQLNIVKNASQQVANIDGADHLSETSRVKCFGQPMELAWGDEAIEPDAFLTGILQYHADGETVSVAILCFDKTGKELANACDVFDATIDASTLSELGESYVRRSGVDAKMLQGFTLSLQEFSKLKRKQKQELKSKVVLKKAQTVRKQAAPFPTYDETAPLTLEALYDGVRVPIEIRNGRGFLPEPQEGQKVEFVLVRGRSAPDRLGVVLKVNGENTLYRQTESDFFCTKWLLGPQHKRVPIRGYQMRGGKTMEAFKVLSQEESQKRAMSYGHYVGQIQLTVFAELAQQDQQPELMDDDEEDMMAMMRGRHPEKKPKSALALKEQIRSPLNVRLARRGLIVQGEKVKNEVRKSTFKPDPTPLMSVTLTYYQTK